MVKNYPYPVLSQTQDDYIKSSKFVIQEPEITKKSVSLDIHICIELESPGLETLLDTGQAFIALSVKMPSTAKVLTQKLYGKERGADFNISYDILGNELVICGYIIAAKDLPGFSLPDEFNPLYFKSGKDTSEYDISKGHILAVNDGWRIPVSSDYAKGMSSLFDICADRKLTSGHEAVFNGDRIKIYVPCNVYQTYHAVEMAKDSNVLSIIYASVVLPELTSAVAMTMDVMNNGLQGKFPKWMEIIQEKIGEMEEEPAEEDAAKIADALLGNITTRSLNSLYTMMTGE